MALRMSTLAILAFVGVGWTPASQQTSQVAQNTESGDKTVDAAQLADREMTIGRYSIGKRNYTGAINNFKTVITQYPTSANAEEALARLVEAYLAIGITLEAQCAAAVLVREFPDGRWLREAREALMASSLEPAADQTCRISRTFDRTW